MQFIHDKLKSGLKATPVTVCQLTTATSSRQWTGDDDDNDDDDDDDSGQEQRPRS